MSNEILSDLQELYSRDPLELTDQDIEKIIEKLRQLRAAFNAGARPGRAAKPTDKPIIEDFEI